MSNFKPTKAMRAAKAKFWTAVNDNPLIDVSALPMTAVANYAGTQSVIRWGQEDEDFRIWFTNKDSVKELVAGGAELAVEKLVSIITAPEHEVGTGPGFSL